MGRSNIRRSKTRKKENKKAMKLLTHEFVSKEIRKFQEKGGIIEQLPEQKVRIRIIGGRYATREYSLEPFGPTEAGSFN